MSNFIRKCRQCQCDMFYTSKNSLDWSEYKKTKCRKCSQLHLHKKGIIKNNIPNIGDLFEYWMVIDNNLIEITKGNWGVKCRCKCGTEKYVRLTALVRGRSKGCICRTKDIAKLKVNVIGDISSTFWSRIIKSSKIRNIQFNITREFAWKLFLKQNKKCALSDLDIIIERSLNRNKGCSNITASLDRIDSLKGYTEDNVQWVHKDVNYMKQDLDQEYFKNICKLITKKWEVSV